MGDAGVASGAESPPFEDGRGDAAPARGRGVAVVAGAFGVLCLALAIACAALVWQYRHALSEESDQHDAMAAAEGTAMDLATIDHRTAQRDVERVLGGATGEFHDDFASSAESFLSVVEDTQVTTVGRDVDAAIESWRDGRGTVLVQVRSTVTNRVQSEEQSRVWRLRLTMEKVDNRYRTADLEYVA